MVYNMSRIRDSLAPGRAQNLLCRSALLMSMFPFLGNVDVKSAFALLLAKVTKPSKGNLPLCAVSGTHYG